MSDIKSARELAMEKLAALEETTDDERLKWKFGPRGTELAARYLNEDANLLVELGQYQDNEKPHVVAAAAEVLVRNIDLPRSDAVRRTNKHVMDGIKLLKTDKTGVENIFSRMRQIFSHFTEQGPRVTEAAV